MAKVITTELQHSGASGANITLDSSKNVTCENNLTVDGTTTLTGAVTLPAGTTSDTLSFRNLIINGAMQVAQRGTSSTDSGYRTVDRFQCLFSGTDEAQTSAQTTLTSSDTGPWEKGFRNAYKITNGNQSSGAGTDDYTRLDYRIEGRDIAQSGWNYASSSSYITLSYWAKSSVAQTFYVRLKSQDGTSQGYASAMTFGSANTWTKFTHKIPGGSSVAFDNDNGEGFRLMFMLFRGTDKTDNSFTLDQWANYNSSIRTKDITSTWWTTDDATFELTGVQLEVGDVATDFEHRTYGDELQRCLRYYYRTGQGQSMASDTGIAQGYNRNTTTGQYTHTFPVPMRVPPTAIETTGTAGDYKISQLTTGTTCDAVPTFDTANTLQTHIYFTVASGLTAGYGSRASTTGAGKYIAFSAEL